jgi:hypothetical protein
MPNYSFIFHKNVYLRQVVEAEDYKTAEEIALGMDESTGTRFETPFLLDYSKRLDVRDVFERTLEIGSD